MSIRIATSDEEIAACFPVMVQLRPRLKREEFVTRIRRQMESGYRLALHHVADRPVAIAGFRVSENLSAGTFLFVDDLVTDATSRSKGYGAELLAWLRAQARAEGCHVLQLDTGVQRKGAQRFYDRQGRRVWPSLRDRAVANDIADDRSSRNS
jgi:GNAT superfamily N-acetyltransferase